MSILGFVFLLVCIKGLAGPIIDHYAYRTNKRRKNAHQ